MKRLLLAMLTALVVWAMACGGNNTGDDDSSGATDDDAGGADDDEADDDTQSIDDDACAGYENNVPPEILAVSFLVNGELRQSPVTLEQSDELEVEFEYSDADCNLDGGGVNLYYPDDGGSCAIWGPIADAGCSSEEQGAPYGFPADPIDFFVAPAGEMHSLGFFVSDVCGAYSNIFLFDMMVNLDR